ncbi:aspartate ammonia-lyase [Atopobacter sp. AH10]|uniref:aspartate ammonia-lyase n=1 Tax=Atopobacter sp. AH10 TaxID=2315861 RepID=UPI000EF19924|nr:aspartate ammonia-lyase [Atopobacter sp. AH10]RLK63428.1 aspartate ammonia-lyase [Atopobacter sp. AH10]
MAIEKEEFRIESDVVGDYKIPIDAYYGVNTQRALENFPITGQKMHPQMIRSLAEIKKACALANKEVKRLEEPLADAIVQACDDVLAGKLDSEFVVDPIQGGAGTSANMNANEVIANRAIEILGGTKGDYKIVSPNDDVNCAQSTNDVYPSSGKIAIIRLLDKAIEQLERLEKALLKKAEEFKEIPKMGRTQLQDAVPITLGQEFAAYAAAVGRDIKRLDSAKLDVAYLNMGGTAIGTCVNVTPGFIDSCLKHLNDITGLKLYSADDLIDGTQNLDCFVVVSSKVKSCAVNLSKMANDLRLMSSGPRTGLNEINLPAKQSGSSIMPGKVNPVIAEVVSQVAFNIFGNDTTVTFAAEAGQLELNAFEPVIFYNLFESIDTLAHVASTFTDNCILGITANTDRCIELVEKSTGLVTVLNPIIGYKKATTIAKRALKEDRNVRDILIEEGLFTEEELKTKLNILDMTQAKK